MQRVPMTVLGAEKLRLELEHLEQVERRKVIEAISEARAHGDLKENAEYHAAKEQQGLIEARIRDIKSKLGNAQVIDVTAMKNNGVVIFGATVKLLNIDTEEQLEYHIVGEDEANIKQGKISVNSPIARGLIGKKLGDELEIPTPAGITYLEILAVNYI